ncbi:MAG: ABC transporter substrate-binding protein [Candidatus ainarchaeum sp.]|nr:ABC transporter substrate-binding protein [Candidatus ainarchaeum sp.]
MLFLGCTQQPAPSAEKPVKIGVLADLSGDYVHLSRGLPYGIGFAVEDLQKETSRPIQVIMEDQKSCDTRETVTIMNKFVNIDNVDIIIGGSCSSTTLAAAPIANKSKTILITPLSTASSISDAGEYVFRTTISDFLRYKAAAQLAYDSGKRRMAIITETSNDAATEISSGVKKSFSTLGGEIVIEEQVPSKSETDFRTQLAKIKAANPDVLIFSVTSPKQVGLIAKQAKELGFSALFIMPQEIEDQEIINIAGDAVEGLIYMMPGNPPESPRYQELKQRYSEKYNDNVVPIDLAESYDATMLGVKAVLASNGTKEDIKSKLFEVSKTYQGVSGSVQFDEKGDVNKTVLIKTIKNGQFVEYKP